MIVGWEGGPTKNSAHPGALLTPFTHTELESTLAPSRPRTTAIEIAAAAATGQFVSYLIKNFFKY